MIIPDKKKMATIIVSHIRPDGGVDDGDEGGDEDEGGDHEMLAGEVMKAIKAGDTKALSDALYAFWEACESEEGEEV